LRRGAERDVAIFDALDLDKDGKITVEEVRGSIDSEARFNDININRDDVVIAAGTRTLYRVSVWHRFCADEVISMIDEQTVAELRHLSAIPSLTSQLCVLDTH